jgi:hypothetical protein
VYDDEQFPSASVPDQFCYYRLLSAEHKDRDAHIVVNEARASYREQTIRLARYSAEPVALLYHEAHIYAVLECDLATTLAQSLFDGISHVAIHVLPRADNLYTAAADNIIIVAFYCTPRQLKNMPAKPKHPIIGTFKLLPEGRKSLKGHDLLPIHFNLLYHWGLSTDAEWNITLQELQYLSNVKESCMVSSEHILETESEEEDDNEEKNDSEMVDVSAGYLPPSSHSLSSSPPSFTSSAFSATVARSPSTSPILNVKIRMSGPSAGLQHFTKTETIADLREHLPGIPTTATIVVAPIRCPRPTCNQPLVTMVDRRGRGSQLKCMSCKKWVRFASAQTREQDSTTLPTASPNGPASTDTSSTQASG